MEPRNVTLIARKEIRDSIRNRWFLLYTVAFGVLALALSYLSMAGAAMYGHAGYGRTAAGLVNLVSLIVPLMALNVGAVSVAGERERGTLRYLLAQPLDRSEIFVGKYLGLAVALLAALTGGFGLSAIALVMLGQAADPGSYGRLVALSFVLALGMLGLGMLVSTLTRKASVAAGISIFLWLGLVFLSDLGLMGSSVAFKLQVADLFGLSLANPIQVFKMAVLSSIHASLDVLGPAGLYATQTFGRALGWLFGGAMATWVLVPPVCALIIFNRTDKA